MTEAAAGGAAGARGLLRAVDAWVFGVERKVVGTLSLVMGLVVFLDVVHRVFSRTPGRVATLLASLTDATPESLDATVAPVIIGLFVFLVAYAAVRTRTPDAGKSVPSKGRSALYALGITTLATGLVQGFVLGRPDGVVSAPYIALTLLLWVGLIGASMATHAGKHLALEMGEKLWPEKLRPTARKAGELAAGLFCLVLLVLGVLSAHDHYDAWRSSGGAAALLPAIEVPKWVAFLVVPYAFGMMALRFIGRVTGVLAPAPQGGELAGLTGGSSTEAAS